MSGLSHLCWPNSSKRYRELPPTTSSTTSSNSTAHIPKIPKLRLPSLSRRGTILLYLTLHAIRSVLLILTAVISLHSLFTFPNFFHMTLLPPVSLLAVIVAFISYIPSVRIPRVATLTLFAAVAAARGFIFLYSRVEKYCAPPSAWLKDPELKWECTLVNSACGVAVGLVGVETVLLGLETARRWRRRKEVESEWEGRKGLMVVEEEDEEDDVSEESVDEAEEQRGSSDSWGEFVGAERRRGSLRGSGQV